MNVICHFNLKIKTTTKTQTFQQTKHWQKSNTHYCQNKTNNNKTTTGKLKQKDAN